MNVLLKGLLCFCGFCLLVNTLQIAVALLPQHCSDPPCITPLFGPDQPVDLYVHISSSSNPARRHLLWNKTSVSTQLEFNVSVNVPLPPGVRSNGSLTAHVTVVRAGSSPDFKQHTRLIDRREVQRRQMLPMANYEDLLSTSALLTRHMKPIRQNRAKLLQTETANQADGLLLPGSIQLWLPYDYTVTLDAVSMLSAAAASSGVLAFMTPSIFVAASRLAVIACLPYLYSRYQLDVAHAHHQTRALAAISAPVRAGAPVTHWAGRLTIRMVTDEATYPALEAPPKLYDKFMLESKGLETHSIRYKTVGGDKFDAMATGENLKYQPVLYVEDNSRQYEYAPLSTNESTADPPLLIEFKPIGRTGFTVTKTLEQSVEMYKSFGATDGDMDEVKYMMTAGLWRMAVMQLIGFTQLTLSALAFKNDISFFKGREDFSGLSSLMTDFAISVIIFLYLCDNEFTSRLVLYPMGFGILIDLWKLKRRLHWCVVWEYMLPWVGSRRDFSNDEQLTDSIDARGMRYIAFVLYPMVACLAAYSLVNNSYKSWWSWFISSLADASYTFGFINMFPQIFVNYKLKSVAHMPWRVIMYKAFNTFIDDAVAWGGIFSMPLKHRLMTLRDDLVFFIFLYQLWHYRVDTARPDEFGYLHNAPAEDQPAAVKAQAHGAETPGAAQEELCAKAEEKVAELEAKLSAME